MMYDHESAWEVIKVYLVTGTVSMFGALAHVLYQVTHGRAFSIGFLLVSLFFGFFTGNLIGGFLPKDFVYRDGVLMLAGFGCYPVLDFIEKNLPTLAERLVDKFMSK